MTNKKNKEQNSDVLPLPVLDIPLSVIDKNGNPAVELRKFISDPNLLKILISSAFHNQPIIIQPKFNNTLTSINNLLEKGILSRDNETGQYFYTF